MGKNVGKEEQSSDKSLYEHLYNSPAPWSSMPRGNEFKNYLLSKRDAGKKSELNESEKKCLADLENYLKEHSEEQEAEIDYDESAIDWTRLKTNYNVVFYLVFPDFFLSKANKNIRHFVLSKFKEESISGIVKYANEQIKKLEEKANGVKNKDDKKESKEEDKEETKKEEKSSKREICKRKIHKKKKNLLLKDFLHFLKKDKQDYEKQSGDSVNKDSENKEKRSKVDDIDQSMIDEAEKLANSREME